jgi:hypothetical protein
MFSGLHDNINSSFQDKSFIFIIKLQNFKHRAWKIAFIYLFFKYKSQAAYNKYEYEK